MNQQTHAGNGSDDPTEVSQENEPRDEGATDGLPGEAPTAEAIEHATRNGSFGLVLQPIVELSCGRWFAFEALSRFPGGEPPDRWFSAADRMGLRVDLEIAAVTKALDLLEGLPTGFPVSVNVSPATLASGGLAKAIRPYPHERVIVEITESAECRDVDALAEQAELLQFRGVRIAIDDLGAGYSRIQQILRLSPDFIKLDKALTAGVATDRARRSLIASLQRYAFETRTEIVAEGVETSADFNTLRGLGIPFGQGWLMGRPVDALTALSQASLLRMAEIT